ncbi:hypothetical protein YC2023_106606 [Brassica napus]
MEVKVTTLLEQDLFYRLVPLPLNLVDESWPCDLSVINGCDSHRSLCTVEDRYPNVLDIWHLSSESSEAQTHSDKSDLDSYFLPAVLILFSENTKSRAVISALIDNASSNSFLGSFSS